MEEIIHAFGIDWRLIVIQMFNFAILVAALWYFLYTPVLKVLSEREAKIRQGIEDAEEAARVRGETYAEKNVVLQDARKEAEGLIHKAEAHAVLKGKDIVKEAEAHAERVLQDAKERAEEAAREAVRKSEAEIARTALLAAEKILNDKAHS